MVGPSSLSTKSRVGSGAAAEGSARQGLRAEVCGGQR